MTDFATTIAKSRELDRVLRIPLKEERMPEIGGSGKMLGTLDGIFEGVRKAVEEAQLGVAGAASELMTEVRGLKAVETALRAETKSVLDFKTKLLGNALAGENEDQTAPNVTKLPSAATGT